MRLAIINEKRYCSEEQEESQLNESLQMSHFSEQPRVVVYRRVKKEKKEEGLKMLIKKKGEWEIKVQTDKLWHWTL